MYRSMPSPTPRLSRGYSLRQKFALAALMTHVMALVIGYAIAMWVRAERLDPSVEPFLLAGFYLLLALCAVLDALWADEVMFAGSFRITALQGKSVESLHADSDLEDMVATTRRPSVTFPLSLIVAGLLNYSLLNFATRDFLGFYDSTGQHVRTLKGAASDEAPQRLVAVRALALNTRPASVRALVRATEHSDADTARWAAWALGRHASMPYAGKLIEPLARALDRDDPAVRREAVLALARVQHRSIRTQLIQSLVGDLEGPKPADVRLVWGLGYLQHLDGLEVLTRALDEGDEGGVGPMAAWAMAQLRDQREGRSVVPVLEQRLLTAPFETACAVVHALSVLGDERSNMVLMRSFDARPPTFRAQTCPAIRIFTGPDHHADERILVRPESFAMKTLQALGRVRATSPEMRALVEPWLETVLEETSDNSLATRQAAANLLEGIRSSRNDLDAEAPAD